MLKQAIASLAGFIGGVNYSNTFAMSAAAQGRRPTAAAPGNGGGGCGGGSGIGARAVENPLYDPAKMMGAVGHANRVTRTYGVEVMSINIISASPTDAQLTKSLAAGAVASSEALQAETAARGRARAAAIEAEAEASRVRIAAEGGAAAAVIEATGNAESERLRADGARKAAGLLARSNVAVELAKMDRSAAMLCSGEKYFFGEEPALLSSVFSKQGASPAGGGSRPRGSDRTSPATYGAGAGVASARPTSQSAVKLAAPSSAPRIPGRGALLGGKESRNSQEMPVKEGPRQRPPPARRPSKSPSNSPRISGRGPSLGSKESRDSQEMPMKEGPRRRPPPARRPSKSTG